MSTDFYHTQTESQLDFYSRWHDLSENYFRWQHKQFEPYLGKCVVDIGCGIGNLTEFSREGRRYIGVDSDPQMIQHLSTVYQGETDVDLVTADITDDKCVATVRKKQPDTVLCINTLEHIDDDRAALKNIFDLLPDGGHCCLLVPALPFLFGSLDRRDGHRRRYSKNDIVGKIGCFPARIIDVYYFNLLGAIGWYIRGKILKARTQASFDYKCVNFLVPIISTIEKVFKPPIGLSLIIICEKVKNP